MTQTTVPPSLFDDPANFLHSIDVDADRAFFFPTNAQLLRDASFVDGRIAIATGETEQAPLSTIIDAGQGNGMTDRFLFNCSFCGSTQLARLLDVPGQSLVLKEPRVLTDIAAWKISNRRDGLSTERLGPTLRLARAALRRPFAPGEKVTVKVASQGNILLENLAEDAARMRPVFITISRRKFLRAIFRGGVERMHYAAKIAWHMAIGETDGDALLRDAVRAGADPHRKAANLAILARYFQVGTFQRAARAGGWSDLHVIDYETIASAPRDAAIKAARALDLEIGQDTIDRNVEALAGRHSKQPQAFSERQQLTDDHALMTAHRQVFDDALSWAESTLGPQRSVVDN